MADFNASLAAPQGAGSNPVSPVHSPAQSSPYMPLVSLAGEMAGLFYKNKAEQKKQDAIDRKEAAISNFTKEQTAIADALQAGYIDSSKASIKSRANFSKYAAAFPAMVEDFNSTNKSLFEHTELGSAKSDEQLLRDENKQLRTSMISAGFIIDENTSKETFESAKLAFQQSRGADYQFKRMAERAAENRSKSAEERQMADYQNKQDSIRLLSDIGDAHLTSSFNEVKELVTQAKASGDFETAKFKLNERFIGIEKSILAVSGMHPELGKQYKAMFDQVKELGMAQLDPKANSEALDRQLKDLQNRVKLTALESSPENKAIYGTSFVFGGVLPAAYTQANVETRNTILNLTKTFSGNTPPVVGNSNVETPTYDFIKDRVSQLEAGKLSNTEGAKQQLSTAANNILSQVSKISDPSTLTKVASFVASPEYAKLVSYGLVDKEANTNANRVFSGIYEREVSNAVVKKSQEQVKPGISYQDLASIRWNGAGVVFDKNDMGTGKKWLNRMEQQERDYYVEELNKKSAVAINQLIHIGAHMEGHTNYAKYWEENKHNILPNVFPDPAKLKVGQVVKAVNGKSYKYVGGDYNDIERSYVEVKPNAD